jgi:hypothetical protein
MRRRASLCPQDVPLGRTILTARAGGGAGAAIAGLLHAPEYGSGGLPSASSSSDGSHGGGCGGLRSVARLLLAKRMVLAMGLNLTFGLVSSFVTSHVNGTVVRSAFGAHAVGPFAAISPAVAGVIALCTGLAQQRRRHRGQLLHASSSDSSGMTGGGGEGEGCCSKRASVSRAFPSCTRSILTEIYLCHACSCQEIED